MLHRSVAGHANTQSSRHPTSCCALSRRHVRGVKAAGLASNTLPADHAASPFHELDIAEIWEGIGRTRVRQHVNPLRREHQVVSPPPDWSAVYADANRPLVVDIGCGPGRFLLLMHKRRSQQEPNMNYLGIEIRKPLVERANEWAQRLGCSKDVHFVSSNATISLATMLATYPGPIQLVTIQFPDPHFKRRHKKRRVFQPDIVRDVASMLAPQGRLLLQSDVEGVAMAMRNIFEKYAYDKLRLGKEHSDPGAVFYSNFNQTNDNIVDVVEAESVQNAEDNNCVEQESDSDDDYETMTSQWASSGWLAFNPLGVPTEREHYVQQQGLPVYRVMLVKAP